jgi:predicted GNAT family acetyltransferase
MVSMANLNSSNERTGQIGGVFTLKEQRQKGYSRATLLHLLKDCREIHHHRKNILFTGEEDFPAQKLYESIGYERIGFFTIVI